MSKLTTIQFHDDTLFAIEDGGAVYVAVRPICDSLGLAPNKQRERIQNDPILSEGGTVTVLPSAGGPQETFCLRIDLVNGWLFTIDVARVKPEIRERVLAYKRECFAVLFRHFYGERATVARHQGFAPDPAETPAREEPVPVRRSLVTEARHTFGTRAAGSLWLALGLPVVPEMREGRRQTEFGFTYEALPTTAERRA